MLFFKMSNHNNTQKNVNNKFNIIIKMGSGSLLIIPWTLKEKRKEYYQQLHMQKFYKLGEIDNSLKDANYQNSHKEK